MSVSLGKGLAEKAEAAVRAMPYKVRQVAFEFANAHYVAVDNGPPDAGGMYCGPVDIGPDRYSVYLLNRSEKQ